MRRFLFSPARRKALLTIFFICSITARWSCLVEAASDEQCTACALLAETFIEGTRRTENQHFAGGNTDWEERKLGKFSQSETRLVEILEYTCKKKHLDDSSRFDGAKEVEFKAHEESLENWYFHKQTNNPDLYSWLCIDNLKLCCPSNHFGAQCSPCPAVFDDEKKTFVCFGRGKCNGAGTREGTGICKCDKGYVGEMCNGCDPQFFPVEQNATFINCSGCDESCKGGCIGAGPMGCRDCKSGYAMEMDRGCTDVDECQSIDHTVCTKANEKCINRPGSYLCICDHGYERKGDLCELDIVASPPPPDDQSTDSPSFSIDSGENETDNRNEEL